MAVQTPMLSHTCMLPACGMRPCTTYRLQLVYRSHMCIVIAYRTIAATCALFSFNLRIDFIQSPAKNLHASKTCRRQTFDGLVQDI